MIESKTEEKIISVILNNPDYFNKVSENLFFNEHCKRMYQIISSIKIKCGKYNKDLIIDYIYSNKNYDIDKFFYLYDVNSIYDKSDFENYLIELTTKKLNNDLMIYLSTLRKNDHKNYSDIKNDITEIFKNTKDVQLEVVKSNTELCIEILEELKVEFIIPKKKSGITWFDEHQGGWDLNDYILLSATESVGKTSFALNLVAKQLKIKLKICFISCEVGRKKLFQLLACCIAGVDDNRINMKIASQEEIDKYIEAISLLYESEIYIIENENRLDRIVEIMKKYKHEKNIDMFYIDHIHQVDVASEKRLSEYEELKIISKEIKKQTIALNTPIFCIAILNKAGKQEIEPQLWHIAGNGKLGYDCDIGILINTEKHEINGNYNQRILKFFVRKNRYNRKGDFLMKFTCSTRRFVDEKNFILEEKNN